MAKFRFTGNLSPADRIERYQVSADKVLELGGEAVSLTDAQADRARQFIQLEEVPEGVEVAQFGPSVAEQQAAAKAESRAPKRGE